MVRKLGLGLPEGQGDLGGTSTRSPRCLRLLPVCSFRMTKLLMTQLSKLARA